MRRGIAELSDRTFDVLVVGAGITGAWIALDCADRGLSVAVIDKGDIGGGTSAKSSKLIHGGIRYLQQLRFDKVRESAMERACYHRAAPHLTRFLPFMVPTYRSLGKGRFLMNAGMALYRLLCAGEDRHTGDRAKKVPPPFHMNRVEVLEKAPLLDPKLTGAVVYYESHMDSSERMTLAVLSTADERGAVCANYVAARGLLQDSRGRTRGLRVEDVDAGDEFDIRSRVTVNATGPWASRLNRELFGDAASVPTTGFSRGSHLVTRPLIDDYAIALPTRFAGQNVIDRGGRHIFVLPWRGHSLIGTSYVGATDIDDPNVSQQEIDQLIGEINTQMPALGLTEADIVHTFSGIYPLTEAVLKEKVYQGTGDYRIVDHAAGGHEGIISAVGAKFTTARLVAEKTTDLVAAKLGKSTRPCGTHGLRLDCAAYDGLEDYAAHTAGALNTQFDAQQTQRLIRLYGTGVEALARHVGRDPALGRPLAGDRPNLAVEVHYAVQAEMAIRLDDVLYRRTGIATIGLPGQACIDRSAAIMAGLLGWDARRRQSEVESLARYGRGGDRT